MGYDLDFGVLADRYMNTVFRIAFNYLKNRADAEDVTQNVMMKLLRPDRSFTDEAHVKNWLIRVTVNECKKAVLSPWRRRVVPLEDCENTLSFETPEQSALFEAVMALPARDRVIVYLYYYEDYPIADISKTTGVSETAIQTRLMRARRKLREKLTGGLSND